MVKTLANLHRKELFFFACLFLRKLWDGLKYDRHNGDEGLYGWMMGTGGEHGVCETQTMQVAYEHIYTLVF